jgi:hypothetical protein
MDKNKQELAYRFQDLVYGYFAKYWEWNIRHNTSLKNQYEKGENNAGIEIKHDQAFEEGSPNIFIAVKRVYPYKLKTTDTNEAPSGIMKNHNKRFYVQGGRDKFFIFALKDIRNYYLTNKPELRDGITSSGGGVEWGFLLNKNKADEIAFEIFDRATLNQTKLEL